MKFLMKLFSIFLIALCFPTMVSAAEIFFSAEGNQFRENEEFVIVVKVDTKGQSINAIEGSIVFPVDLVDVKQIEDGNSAVNFWVEKPYIESYGVVKFAGITPGGFTGENNSLFSVVLRATGTGTGAIYGREVKSLENNGLGSNVQIKNLSLPIIIYKDELMGRSPYKIPDDKELPESFTPIIANTPDLFNGKNILIFSTQDKGSGISHYEVREGEWGWFRVVKSPYVLENQSLNKKIFVKAIDNRGNERMEVLEPIEARLAYPSYIIFAMLLIAVVFLFAKYTWKKYSK